MLEEGAGREEEYIDHARRELVKQMLAARTPEEVRAAWYAQQAWLEQYPEDRLVQLAAEEMKKIAPRWY